ncbi:MAG: sporulation protein YabP [Oscillospiraceae bacterium]|nr:sporulation protein YabP [Oscillospiraceae bacterium]
MSDKIFLPHTVTMENRNSMTVTGVVQVVAYDEFHIILKTDYGTLLIRGRDLTAGEISSASNTLKLTGTVESLQYKGMKNKSESFMSRIFR